MRGLRMGLLALAWLWPALASAQAMTAGSSPEMLDKRLVDIGHGRRLNMVCIGQGAPTLVFEHALGGTILDWQYIQADLSKTNRTCFYDRAGYGQSPASDQPRTPRNVTDDLHALLRKAGVRRPVVLIGHSIGGRYATDYYERFPKDVAGMVLIDPGFYGQDDLNLSGPDQALFDGLRTKAYAKWANCAAKARSHEMTLAAPQGCFGANLPYYTRDEAARMLPVYQRPERWETIASEYGHIDEDGAPRTSWGALPLVVLTRTQFPPTPGASDSFNQSVEAVLKQGHAALAARSSRGVNITVPNSNHYMQANQPEPVLAAIRELIAEVKAAK